MSDEQHAEQVATDAGGAEGSRDDFRLARRVSLLARIEFALINVAAIVIVVVRLTQGADAHVFCMSLWWSLIVPGYLIGAALTGYHAKVTARPWSELSGEVAFWAVAPATTGLALFFLATQVGP